MLGSPRAVNHALINATHILRLEIETVTIEIIAWSVEIEYTFRQEDFRDMKNDLL